MIDNRTLAILMELFATSQMNLYELSIQTGIDKGTLQSSIEIVNQLLKEQSLDSIDFNEEYYSVPDSLLKSKDQIFQLFSNRQIYLSQEQRQLVIYLYTFIRKDFVSNVHYQDLLSVSRNTTLTDIKNLRELCQRFAVQFEYSRSLGYHLVGDESDKYRVAIYAISECLQSSVGIWALDYVLKSWSEPNLFEDLKMISQQTCQVYQVSALEGRLDEFLYFLMFLAIRRDRVQDDLKSVGNQVNYIDEFVQHLWSFIELKRENSDLLLPGLHQYLAHLLQGCLEGDITTADYFFQQLTLEIVEEMERLSLITFENRQEMIEGLKRHLIPAYYRLTLQLVNVNSYTEVIKKEHTDLFILVKKALKPLEAHLDFPISDSEVSYFVIHFGGYIEANKKKPYRYEGLIVCPNGVSSSLIVKENLRQLFPNIHFADTQSLQQLKQIDTSKYDMIFGTIKIDTTQPFFLVPQIMSESQKKELFQLVNNQFNNAGYFPIEIEQLLSVIGKYATVHQEQSLKYELVQFLNKRLSEKRRRSPMLSELITKETFQRSPKSLSWREAITLAAQPLLHNDTIEASYVDAMIAKVEEFGPFIDLGKGIAIPHARPEDGVKQVGMSMLVLDKPVQLLDDPSHEIRLFICIAAVDNQSHLRALSHLTKILREDNYVKQLIEAQAFDDIKNLLMEEQ
ncbi:BglG family transcription antiterminator [Streptococcus suis]|nr:BglG family transcription antiterminator [Streptococcus suis]